MVTATYADRDVTVNGLKLHYQEWGDPAATPLVMLHGFGVSGHMFDEFAERVKDRYHLVALDQRGHGDSAWAEDGNYSRDAFVSDVEGFRKALGLDRFILMGHSMGGLNSVSYTAAHPDAVRALILVDVGPESAREGVDNIVRFTRGPDELDFEEFVQITHHFNPRRSIENIRERMRHRLKPTESGKYTWKFDKRFRSEDRSILRIGSELTNEQTWQLYRGITAPTLLVRGAESDVLTPDVAERAQREMQRARVVTVAGAGHSVPGDNPDGFTSVVEAFLADLDHGAFEPEVEVSLPPLEQLVTANDRQARRHGPSTRTLVLAGAGAALAVAAIALSRSRKPAKPSSPKAGPTPNTAELINDLSKMAAANLAVAQQLAVAATPSRTGAPPRARRKQKRKRGAFLSTAIIAWKVASFAPKLALRNRTKAVEAPRPRGLLR